MTRNEQSEYLFRHLLEDVPPIARPKIDSAEGITLEEYAAIAEDFIQRYRDSGVPLGEWKVTATYDYSDGTYKMSIKPVDANDGSADDK